MPSCIANLSNLSVQFKHTFPNYRIQPPLTARYICLFRTLFIKNRKLWEGEIDDVQRLV